MMNSLAVGFIDLSLPQERSLASKRIGRPTPSLVRALCLQWVEIGH
jgi:hypothetical protein